MSETSLSSPINNDERPVPEIVADAFDFKLAFHDTEYGRFYSVQDWLLGVAQTPNPHKFWDSLQRRVRKATQVELSSRCRVLPYRAINGKTYRMHHADAETLYYITQRMDAETGIRDEVLKYLAKAGVIVDELRHDPDAVTKKAKFDKIYRRLLAKGFTHDEARAMIAELRDIYLEDLADDPEEELRHTLERLGGRFRRQGKTDNWIEARIQGIITRKQFVEALKAAVLSAPPQLYALATDKLYLGLWERTTAQLRGELNLTKRQNPRDHFGTYALVYTRLTEMICADKLDEVETVTLSMAIDIVWTVAKKIHEQAQSTAELLGIDLVTERKLLQQ